MTTEERSARMKARWQDAGFRERHRQSLLNRAPRRKKETIEVDKAEKKARQERRRKRLEAIQYVNSLPAIPKHTLPPAPFCEKCGENFWCEHNLEKATKKEQLSYKQEELIFGE